MNATATEVLKSLYLDARTNDPLIHEQLRNATTKPTTGEEHFKARSRLYMPVGREFGNLLYTLVRSSKATTIVEFGTSFGISTIFLASGVADNGAGRVVTAEFIAEKSAKAKQNLTDAKLESYVEFLVGDALTTLKEPALKNIDFVFLDGEKSLYLKVLKILEPKMKPGCVIAADNTDHDGLEDFLLHVRDPKNGYVSSAILTGDKSRTGAHEISYRL